MLYELFKLLDKIDFPGAGLFEFLTFRAAMAILGALAISLIFGGKLINILKEKQIGESVRDLGLDGQIEKSGTPTMGGLIILSAIIVPVWLVADLGNIYIKGLLLTTIWMGASGFTDDCIKVFKNNKKGLLIDSLVNRVKKNSVKEVILATSATVEGQTTAHYIQDSLKDYKVKITKLAQGISVGTEIEFADDGSLLSAFKNRSPIITN